MFEDDRGLPFTTSSAEAAEHFNQAMRCYHDYKLPMGGHVKAALAADPEFALAHTMKGYMMMMFGTVATLPSARKSLAAAETLAEGATERERMHMAALSDWIEGDIDGSNRHFERILADHPQDLLALKILNFSYFWLGDKANVLQTAVRARAQWSEDTPGFGYVLGMQAFGLEENHQYEEAERTGRRAVEIHAADAWATHAVAHVLEMQGRQREGVAWMDGLKHNWEEINNFGVHLWWHRALYHLELEQYGKVLELYDGEVRKEQTDFYSDLQNAIALLWRLRLRGVDVGGRWVELADKAEQRIEDHAFPYNESHYVMALVADGRVDSARKLIDHRRAYAASAGTTRAPLLSEVYLPACEALLAFQEGNYEKSARQLAEVNDQLVRGGGSDAQRDVFTLTMIGAALCAERFDLAKDWLAERTRARANSADSWRAYALALDGCGDAAGAENARGRMEALLAAS